MLSLQICTLVAIYKHHIKHHTHLRGFHVCIAYTAIYLVRPRRSVYPGTCEIFHLIIYLKSVYLSTFTKAAGHTQSTVSAERAHFKNIPGIQHFHDKREQFALKVTAGHSAVYGVDIGGTQESIQIVVLRFYMGKYVFVERHIYFLPAVKASTPRRYESRPKPAITPLQPAEIILLWLNSSRPFTLLI